LQHVKLAGEFAFLHIDEHVAQRATAAVGAQLLAAAA
jgi:hypothetical protein